MATHEEHLLDTFGLIEPPVEGQLLTAGWSVGGVLREFRAPVVALVAVGAFAWGGLGGLAVYTAAYALVKLGDLLNLR